MEKEREGEKCSQSRKTSHGNEMLRCAARDVEVQEQQCTEARERGGGGTRQTAKPNAN